MNDRQGADPTARVREAFRALGTEWVEPVGHAVSADPSAWMARWHELADRIRAIEDVALSELRALANAARQAKDDADRLAAENRAIAARCLDAEAHNNDLASLYTAGYQLQTALDPDAAVEIIVEIAVNLIGAADFAVCLVEESTQEFVTVHRHGDTVPIAPRRPRRHLLPQEDAAIEMRRTFFSTEDTLGPLSCTPLYFDEQLVGVLSIYRLLSHKEGYTSLDWQIMDLLAAQAAIAITSARARLAMDRKLKTVQGFIDLIKP
jgi:GAF domain-containing protein